MGSGLSWVKASIISLHGHGPPVGYCSKYMKEFDHDTLPTVKDKTSKEVRRLISHFSSRFPGKGSFSTKPCPPSFLSVSSCQPAFLPRASWLVCCCHMGLRVCNILSFTHLETGPMEGVLGRKDAPRLSFPLPTGARRPTEPGLMKLNLGQLGPRDGSLISFSFCFYSFIC